MMNPYQLNWPGLRDVPVVTIETDTGNIYSQENLLPLKRGKLDRIEYKYVPIEAVLDEFNAEIELEEAFETLTSILDIPGVKALYTDKATGRKYVHVSSLLALIVVRPEDGPGFEMACNGILHFLTNHMEMACLECGYIRRDCQCQDFDICYDRSSIECVSFVKQTTDKNVQTDPIPSLNIGAAVDNGLRTGASATTVYLPPGANLADCERLPDGRLNIRYITTSTKNPGTKSDVHTQSRPMLQPAMVSSLPGTGVPPGFMLPPHVSHYPPMGNTMPSPFLPPSCHASMHSNMMHGNPYMHLPSPTFSAGPIPSIIPAHMHAPNSMNMQRPGPYNIRSFNPYVPPPPTSTQGSGHPFSRSILSPPIDGPAVKKRAPTPTGNSSCNGTEVKRKRKNGSTVNNCKENQLKVKLNFKTPASAKESKEELKPLPAKRMKKPRTVSSEENPSLEKKDSTKNDPNRENKESSTKENTNNTCNESPDKPPKSEKGTEGDISKSEVKHKEGENETSEKEDMNANTTNDENSPEICPSGEVPEDDKSNSVESEKPIEEPKSGERKDSNIPPPKTPATDLPKPAVDDFLPKSDITGKGWNKFEYAPTGQKIIRCLTCGQCFDKECYADKHQEMHTLNRTLSCSECDYSVTYSRWYILLRHLYSKHQIKFVDGGNSCKLCGNVFDTIEELEEHVDAHHYNKYKCAYCGQSLLSWDAYKTHVQTCPQISQGKIYYSCPYCHFAFRDRVMKQVHVKSHQDNMLVCCYCRDSNDWGNWKLLKNHYELLHLPKLKDRNPKKARTCVKCSGMFKSYKGYRNHTAKCTGPKVTPTPPESKESQPEEKKDNEENEDKDKTEEGGDKEEKKTGSEEKENKEDTADKVAKASKEGKPKVGRKPGKQKGTHKCEKCHKKFGAAATLDRHMVYAHGPEAKCDECDHVAKSQMLLKMHKTLKHSDKRHVCSECNRTFQYYHQYKVHLAWHARKVNYACPTCDAEFPRQVELRQHQLKDHPSSNNRTVFTCSECDFKCFSRTTLRAHLKNKHVSSDEDEDGRDEDNDPKYQPGDKASSGADESEAPSDGEEQSESGSEVGEDDMKNLFSWRKSQPAPPGARRSQRTPKPSAILKDIAKTRTRKAIKKKQLPSKKGRKRRTPSTSSSRAPSTSQQRPLQRTKGRPPKKTLKKVINAKKMKKEKVIKNVKLRRCGCARFRTYEEFKILKRRQQASKIVERTIVEDPNTPMRRRTISQDSQGCDVVTVSNTTTTATTTTIKPEVPEVSWTYDTSCSSLSSAEKQRLLAVVLDHCYYQKPSAPENKKSDSKSDKDNHIVIGVEEEEDNVVNDTQDDPVIGEPEVVSPKAKAASPRRKRSSTSGDGRPAQAAAVPGQSPAKVRATVNDLESAIKFADNVTQLSKLVSILRADKETLPSSSTAICYLQSPVKAAKVPAAQTGTETLPVPVAQTPLTRTYAADYEIGELEPLPSDIMASEIESDMDLEGMMSEILEEMGQENNQSSGECSGVSADVSQAAEVLLSLDMSGEERELALQETPEDGVVETADDHEDEDVSHDHNVATIQQNLEEVLPPELTDDPTNIVCEEASAETELIEHCDASSVHKQIIAKNIPADNPKVAVELNDTDIPQNDFLFWAAKNDEDEHEMVLRPPQNGIATSPTDSYEKSRNAWQLDHQYI